MINLLTPPIFDDEDKTLVAHHLFIIIWTFMAVSWLAIFIAVIIPETIYRWLLIVGVIESAGLILLVLNKYGHTRLVSNLLIFIMWATATGMAFTGGGTSSNAMAIYFIIVLIAGLVQSGKAGIVTAIFCSLTGLFLVYLEYGGALPTSQVLHTPLTQWIANTIYMTIIIGLQYLVSRTIRKALKQSRQELKERQQVDAALRETEDRYRALVENASDIVFRTDENGYFTFVNPAALRISGYEENEIIGKHYKIFFRPGMFKEAITFFANQLIKKIKNTYYEYPIITKDGHEVWLGQNTQVIMEEDHVTGFQAVARDITERKRAEEALRESERRYRELSIIDDLTQLYNSRYFYHQLKMEIDRVNRYGQPLTLLLLDLDDFKQFNDTYGHIEGDQVLMRLGQVVKRCLRQTDSAYRYGGEEFTILLPMTTSEDGAVTAERIRAELKKEIFSPVSGKDIHITVSIGLAQYKPQEDMKAFVHRVDQLMYQAKKNGKDRVCSES